MADYKLVNEEVDKLLTEWVGATRKQLDPNSPAAWVLVELTQQSVRAAINAKNYAASLARELDRYGSGKQEARSVMSGSDLRNYEAAVASVEALRTPLAAALVAYKSAHNLPIK